VEAKGEKLTSEGYERYLVGFHRRSAYTPQCIAAVVLISFACVCRLEWLTRPLLSCSPVSTQMASSTLCTKISKINIYMVLSGQSSSNRLHKSSLSRRFFTIGLHPSVISEAVVVDEYEHLTEYGETEKEREWSPLVVVVKV
jgi:hypothetical protein